MCANWNWDGVPMLSKNKKEIAEEASSVVNAVCGDAQETDQPNRAGEEAFCCVRANKMQSKRNSGQPSPPRRKEQVDRQFLFFTPFDPLFCSIVPWVKESWAITGKGMSEINKGLCAYVAGVRWDRGQYYVLSWCPEYRHYPDCERLRSNTE